MHFVCTSPTANILRIFFKIEVGILQGAEALFVFAGSPQCERLARTQSIGAGVHAIEPPMVCCISPKNADEVIAVFAPSFRVKSPLKPRRRSRCSSKLEPHCRKLPPVNFCGRLGNRFCFVNCHRQTIPRRYCPLPSSAIDRDVKLTRVQERSRHDADQTNTR